MKSERKNWSRDELIIVFNLYCRTPFGRIHKTNPDIIEMSKNIGRTPSAVAMKMVNFARLDPFHKERSVKGLAHGSKQDKIIWDEFNNDWENLAYESQKILYQLGHVEDQEKIIQAEFYKDIQKTELKRNVKIRLVQNFFRETVLASYDFACAICLLSVPEMLNASHIIPWSKSKLRRADPRNGLSLCVLHDRAFDRGLISIDKDYCVIISKKLKPKRKCRMFEIGFREMNGKKIKMPDRFLPDQIALDYHRDEIFLK